MLVQHYAEGGTFETFAAVVDVDYSTLYDWEGRHPEFARAKNKGKPKSYKFYLEMGKLIATGQMRRVSKERPIIDDKGRPVLGPDGKVLYEREYSTVVPNAAVWIFMMKNMHGWRDIRNHAFSGDGHGAPIPIEATKSTPQEKLKELMELRKVLREIEENNADVRVIDAPA